MDEGIFHYVTPIVKSGKFNLNKFSKYEFENE